MADPVIFVPGLNCTGALFDHQIAAVAGERTVTVANHRDDGSIDDMAATLLAEAPERFVLAGLSMGGYVALAVMRAAPERVKGLVLMDTSARPDSDEARERRERQIAIAEAGRFGEIPDLQLPMLVHPSRLEDETITIVVRAMAEETGADAFVRQQRAIMARPDSRPVLGRIACPTLVVVGDKDAITPPEIAEEMVSAIPGARLAVMPVCGHLSTLERPTAVTHAFTTFLADHGL
ncbi:alpha/beta fold hydrolase [Chthonobacter rhizosphaerae]|uniref:alpha/beta fold hydrolase n=1 Tax=Chthonobacter rhizosphaerae TaxID=2735553 RepID=UPI0015EE696C|nr:alpha/beta fold hydrolase [Chthonobacter rhizosphaerae]